MPSLNIRKKIIIEYIAYIFAGSLMGVFIIQPVNDMVIYHMYEANTSGLTSWGFIFDNLGKAFIFPYIKKTIYYLVVGSFVGLLTAFMSATLRKKLSTINSLNKELARDIDLLISQGEGPAIEFKSSFRWDLNEKRANKALESVVLKTIAGFMNSNGGSLLVGVADDGETIGLGSDYKLLKRADSDGFEQAIITTVSTNLGTDLCQFIHPVFHAINEQEICRIIIKAATRPVYLKHKGSTQFYLRTGGGTRAMNIQEATEYIKGHWD